MSNPAIALSSTIAMLWEERAEKWVQPMTPSSKAGDRLEFKVSGGIISILPKLPSADDDEYTPEQRHLIDAELAEASKGPYYGPLHPTTRR